VLDACDHTSNGTHLDDSPCQNHGHCGNGTRPDSPGEFLCECPVGYTGKLCETGLMVTVYTDFSSMPHFARLWFSSTNRVVMHLRQLSLFSV